MYIYKFSSSTNIPVHMNVQFAGRLHALEEQQKHYAFHSRKKKLAENERTIPFALVHTYIEFGVILIIHAVLKRPAPFP